MADLDHERCQIIWTPQLTLEEDQTLVSCKNSAIILSSMRFWGQDLVTNVYKLVAYFILISSTHLSHF